MERKRLRIGSLIKRLCFEGGNLELKVREAGEKGIRRKKEVLTSLPPHPPPSNSLVQALRKILYICDTPVFHTNRKK